MTDAIEQVETERIVIRESINEISTSANAFKIKTKDDFDTAQVLLEKVLKKKKDVKEYWDPVEKKAFDSKKAASDTLREVRDKIDEMIGPLDKAEDWLRDKRQIFKNACDEIDRKEKAALEEKSTKAAAKEQDKLLKKADKASDPVVEEALIEKADEIVAEPVFQKQTVKKSVKTVSGTRNTWQDEVEVQITNAKKLCAMIGNGSLPINIVTISLPKLRAYVKSFDKKDGNYEGYSVKRKSKERVTLGK